jgi:hypothetical protein
LRRDKLDARAGAVAVEEDLVGYATDISLGDCIDFVQIAEELTPVAETRLVLGELMGETVIVRKTTEQFGSGSSLEAR